MVLQPYLAGNCENSNRLILASSKLALDLACILSGAAKNGAIHVPKTDLAAGNGKQKALLKLEHFALDCS